MNIFQPNQTQADRLAAIAAGEGSCIAYLRFTVGTTAVQLEDVVGYQAAGYVVFRPEAASASQGSTQILRFREDPGTNISATEGMPLGDQEVRAVAGSNVERLRFISADGQTHTVHAQLYAL